MSNARGRLLAAEARARRAARSLLEIYREAAEEVVFQRICSIRTGSQRSQSAPENQPPNAEVNNVTAPISPALPLLIDHQAISVGVAKL